MLDGLERSSGRLAEAINTPPLDVEGLRSEWAELKREAASIPAPRKPSVDGIQASWNDLREEAKRQERSVFELSSLMALSAVARLPEDVLRLSRGASRAAGRTGSQFASAILDHYTETLADIRRDGFVKYWVRAYRPYLAGAAEQFSPARRSLTERWLGPRRPSDRLGGNGQ
jgi:hypothetical protein